MSLFIRIPLTLMLCIFLSGPARADETKPAPDRVPDALPDLYPNVQGKNPVDFEFEDVFVDVEESVRSKQYVRRAILSTAIRQSSRFGFDRPYIQHLVAFSAVFQRINFAKFTTGSQGLSAGYVLESGHAFEAGAEFSAVSNIFAGYKYIFRPDGFSLWPFAGVGAGREVGLISFSDGPPEAEAYDGRKEMIYLNVGLLVPLVDVGLRAEVRASLYGKDRFILTNGVGIVVFI